MLIFCRDFIQPKMQYKKYMEDNYHIFLMLGGGLHLTGKGRIYQRVNSFF